MAAPVQETMLDSSPRTRRYFRKSNALFLQLPLFSAHAEVFPLRAAAVSEVLALLRARGGISEGYEPPVPRELSSPRTRRYFLVTVRFAGRDALFSAHAEGFPVDLFTLHRHACSSPRTRRYFRKSNALFLQLPLFSAHAEVFPARSSSRSSRLALLRARGGISLPTTVFTPKTPPGSHRGSPSARWRRQY